MHVATDLRGLGDIPGDWTHNSKDVTPAAGLQLPGAYLKWYDVHPPERPIPQAERDRARDFLRDETVAGRIGFQNELGFVVLHLSGSAYFVIACVWRSINEMWQVLYAKVGDEGYQSVPDQVGFRPTQCVWELGPTAYERQAWSRYLTSERDETAKRTYINDQFTGPV